jgi:hypothetical protein
MSGQQLYLVAGIPAIVNLVGILVNVAFFEALKARLDSLNVRLGGRIRLEERLKH